MIVQEKIILEFAEFTLVKDKVVCVDYLNEETLNVERGIRLVEAIKKLTNNEPCVVVHNVGDKYIFSTDALRFMGSQLTKENHSYLGRAIVTTNAAARIATNNFIKFFKPVVPARLFSELETAMQWAEELAASSK